MLDAMLLIAVLAASYFGFAALALSQDRHWHHLVGGRHCPPDIAKLLRYAGYVLIFCALLLALERDGPSFGSLLWATAISVAALAVVATLSWRAHWLLPVARLAQHIG